MLNTCVHTQGRVWEGVDTWGWVWILGGGCAYSGEGVDIQGRVWILRGGCAYSGVTMYNKQYIQ